MKTLNRNFIRAFCLVLTVALLSPLCFGAKELQPTSDFFVNDYAEILSEETKSELMSNAKKLYSDTSAQVVFLSIKSLDGRDIEEYSVDIFRSWGIGDKEKDNGVLFLFSLEDREMWVTTGYGVEGTLTDIKLGALRDTYAFPYYKNDDFDQGTKELFNALINELRINEYGLEPIGEYEDIDTVTGGNYEEDDDSFVFLFVLLPFFIVGFGFLGQKIKMAYLKAYDKRHGTNKAKVYEEKLKAKKKAASQNDDNDHHTGGFYGGFYGGGGGGFSGGGGGFSGGGGSTGGGGAGGSF